MFRFTIRDVLWLTLTVSIALGWLIHQRQLRWENERERTSRYLAEMVAERKSHPIILHHGAEDIDSCPLCDELSGGIIRIRGLHR